MKIYQIIFIAAMLAGSAVYNPVSAQAIEESITVQGVCNDCKKRIEDAAYGKGVKFAEWDKESKLLKVAFNSGKTSLNEIEQRIAKAGHNTTNVAASRDDYESLPKCCQYDHMHDH